MQTDTRTESEGHTSTVTSSGGNHTVFVQNSVFWIALIGLVSLTFGTQIAFMMRTQPADVLEELRRIASDTRPADVLQEVLAVRRELDTIKDEIRDRTDDRWHGEDHRAFAEALFQANPNLKRPEGY